MQFKTLMKMVEGNHEEDVRIVLEYLKMEYPKLPEDIKLFLYNFVRTGTLAEYTNYDPYWTEERIMTIQEKKQKFLDLIQWN